MRLEKGKISKVSEFSLAVENIIIQIINNRSE
jgi:hypothetical protein